MDRWLINFASTFINTNKQISKSYPGMFGRTLVSILACCFALSLPAQAADEVWFSPCPEFGSFRFESGFEDSLNIQEDSIRQLASIRATKLSPCCQDDKGLKSTLGFGSVNIQFEGGNSRSRGAEILQDPAGVDNKVLGFWVRKPNVLSSKGSPEKGRVQMNAYENKGIRHVKMSVRLFLHPDFATLSQYPSRIDWLTLSEWWNNASWTQEQFPFRITVGLYKDPGDAPFYFHVVAQTLDIQKNVWNGAVWQSVNKQFPIPVGKWITLDYEFIEGAKEKGNFSLAMTPEGGDRTVVFDIHNYTHHPDDKSPDGLSHFNPLKLYTSAPIINFLDARNKMLQLYWDDLKLIAAPN